MSEQTGSRFVYTIHSSIKASQRQDYQSIQERMNHAAQHVDQQLDHGVTDRLLTGALAESPVRQLFINNIQAMDSGRVQHNFCSTGTFTDAVLDGSRLSLEHTGVLTAELIAQPTCSDHHLEIKKCQLSTQTRTESQRKAGACHRSPT